MGLMLKSIEELRELAASDDFRTINWCWGDATMITRTGLLLNAAASRWRWKYVTGPHLMIASSYQGPAWGDSKVIYIGDHGMVWDGLARDWFKDRDDIREKYGVHPVHPPRGRHPAWEYD